MRASGTSDKVYYVYVYVGSMDSFDFVVGGADFTDGDMLADVSCCLSRYLVWCLLVIREFAP